MSPGQAAVAADLQLHGADTVEVELVDHGVEVGPERGRDDHDLVALLLVPLDALDHLGPELPVELGAVGEGPALELVGGQPRQEPSQQGRLEGLTTVRSGQGRRSRREAHA